MRLYILRHGKAERHSDSGRDEDRPLSDRGKAQAEGVARLLTAGAPPAELTRRPTRILSSPAARADATARIVGAALALEVKHEEALALDASFRELLSLAERMVEGPGPALLVGHNPLLSRLIDHLAGADELRTGELSVIELGTAADAGEVGRFRMDK